MEHSDNKKTISKLAQVFQSDLFKRIIFFIAIILLVLSLFIIIDPTPFLKFGYFGVFIASIFGASTVLVVPLFRYFNLYLLAFVIALGMGINDSVSFIVGKNGDVIIPRNKRITKFENTIQKYGVVALFVWSLIPFPYDIIGLIAGYLNFKYYQFIIPTFLGKFVRFILIGFSVIGIFGAVYLR